MAEAGWPCECRMRATSYSESHVFSRFPSSLCRNASALDARRSASPARPCASRIRDRSTMSPEKRGLPVRRNVSSVKSRRDGHRPSTSSASSGRPMRRRRLAMLLYELPMRSLPDVDRPPVRGARLFEVAQLRVRQRDVVQAGGDERDL